MSTTILDLGDPTPKTELVKIGTASYLLEEASGAAVAKYRDVAISGAVMKDGKVTGVKDVARGEALLVSLCLFAVKPDGTKGAPVPPSVVSSWPGRIQSALFDRVKDMSGLNKASSAEELRTQIADLQAQLEEVEGTGPKATTDDSPSG